MSLNAGFPERTIFQRILTPWRIAAVLLVIFAVGEAYLAWRDRGVESALENDPVFTTPSLDFAFSSKIAYDPLSFVGRGAQAGLWKWTPEALVLTENGRHFFEASGEMLVSRAVAGKRRIQRIRTNVETGSGDRRIGFLYQWSEVSPPGAALLSPPPRVGEEYPGEAVMTRESGSWKLKSLRTQDFDESLARLKLAASGVRK